MVYNYYIIKVNAIFQFPFPRLVILYKSFNP